MDVLEISKKILHEGPICDHCMGRQFAKLSTGLSNRERGQAMKLALVLEGDRIYKSENDDSLLKELVPCSGQKKLQKLSKVLSTPPSSWGQRSAGF